jgi:hypothetical protein
MSNAHFLERILNLINDRNVKKGDKHLFFIVTGYVDLTSFQISQWKQHTYLISVCIMFNKNKKLLFFKS